MIGKRIGISFVLMLIGAFLFISAKQTEEQVKDYTKLITDLSLETVLLQLGDKKALHYIDKIDLDSVSFGLQLITKGKIEGKSNKRLSKFFVCTDCHNLTRESYNLADESPKARLKYGMEKGIAFLPASSFYGMYNKIHWYNGDYKKKYGSLVDPTRDTLANAIQLCAVECSQGRRMEDWEIRSIIHYYKSNSIQISDLTLTNLEKTRLTDYVLKKNKSGIKFLKTKYNVINKATFGDPKEPIIEGYSPNIKSGEYIFNNGCLHCHDLGKNITNFEFDKSDLTLSFLESKIKKHGHFSVPYLVRKGTYSIVGRKQYMPQYPLEKMSNNQLLDLLAYISNHKNN